MKKCLLFLVLLTFCCNVQPCQSTPRPTFRTNGFVPHDSEYNNLAAVIHPHMQNHTVTQFYYHPDAPADGVWAGRKAVMTSVYMSARPEDKLHYERVLQLVTWMATLIDGTESQWEAAFGTGFPTCLGSSEREDLRTIIQAFYFEENQASLRFTGGDM